MTEQQNRKLVQTMRKELRKQVTRINNLVSTKSQANELSSVEIQVWHEKLSRIKPELLDMDSKFLSYLTDENEIETECASISDYDERLNLTLIYLKEKLPQLDEPNTSKQQANVNVSTMDNQVHRTNLPKLELPKFSGKDPTKWFNFIEQFQVTIGNNANLTLTQKFQYLWSLLEEGSPAKKSVSGYIVTGEFYEEVLNTLKKKYGDKTKIEKQHIRNILNLSKVNSSKDIQGLQALEDELNLNTRALQSLGVSPDSYRTLASEIVIKCLPSDLRTKFYTIAVPNETTDELSQIISFLENEISARIKNIECEKSDPAIHSVRINKPKSKFEVRTEFNDKRSHHIPSTTNFLADNNKSAKFGCIFCGDSKHRTFICSSNVSIIDKKNKLKELKRCFRCTGQNHASSACYSKIVCQKCKGKHATSMCEPEWNKRQADKSSSNNTIVVDTNTHSSCQQHLNRNSILLQTAIAQVQDINGKLHEHRMLFDNGSQRSYVEQSVADSLKLKVVDEEKLKIKSFRQVNCEVENIKRVLLPLKAKNTSDIYTIEALVVKTIGSSVLPSPPENLISQLKEIKFEVADRSLNNVSNISILIGSDYTHKLVTSNSQKIARTNILAVETVFGWVLHGPLPLPLPSISNEDITLQACSKTLCSCTSVYRTISNSEEDIQIELLKNSMTALWDNEKLGLVEAEQDISEENSASQQAAEGIVQLANGKYQVPLIWNKAIEIHDLKTNRHIALKRLENLLRKITPDPELAMEYHTAITEYLRMGFAEEVDESVLTDEPVYYMPHRAVIKKDSSTTKCRIVFDASSKEKGSTSLNDHLLKGKNLNPDLIHILINFRTFKYALTADITKAFLQVALSLKDRNVLRYFWFDQAPTSETSIKDVKVYRQTVVPFGIKCSPYLLAFATRYNLKMFSEDLEPIAKLVDKSLYVDDFIAGANDLEEAYTVYKTVKKMFLEMGMEMVKWTTNNSELQRRIDLCENVNSKESDPSGFSKVLGLIWNPETENLQFKIGKINKETQLPITKRKILQVLASVFDPLGQVSPITVIAKILLQHLWKEKLDWDDKIPEELQHIWNEYLGELLNIFKIKISRYLFTGLEKSTSKYEIHAFSDASPQAYGAIVFVRAVDAKGTIKVSQIFAKARVAPLKQIQTIPRLELNGCLVAAKLVNHTLKGVDLSFERIIFWTDSTISLYWITNKPEKRKIYVANRVKEILSHTDVSQWRYVPGNQNPADYLTRGTTVDKLLHLKDWWEGPEFLHQQEREWPPQHILSPDDDMACEDIAVLTTQTEDKPIDWCSTFSRFSIYNRMVRTFAYVVRFINNSKSDKSNRSLGNLTAEEIHLGEQLCIKITQRTAFPEEMYNLQISKPVHPNSSIATLNPFLDSGIMRVRGRLQQAQANYDEKHPIILPTKSEFGNLLIKKIHLHLLHSGVSHVLTTLRGKFWIIRGRQQVKSLLNKCIICKRYTAKAYEQDPAPLPQERLTSSNEPAPLRPCDLLTGGKQNILPAPEKGTIWPNPSSGKKELQRRITYRQRLSNDFWSRWQKEYIQELRSVHLYQSEKPYNIKEGQIVLLSDEKSKRHLWPLARILEVYPGRDGKIRSCLIKTSDGRSFRRAVQHLHYLEVDEEADADEDAEEEVGNNEQAHGGSML